MISVNSDHTYTEPGRASVNGSELDDAEVLVRFEALRGMKSIVLIWDQQRLELAARSGGVVLRPRDARSPECLSYLGTETSQIHQGWVVTAHFIPAPREDVEVDSAAGVTATDAAATRYYASPGRAEFEANGQPLRQTLFGSYKTGDPRAVFADAIGKDLTFPTARFVDLEKTSLETVVIHFNRPRNPPCAYSASARCPFPHPESRLPVRIESGGPRPG